MTPNPLTIFPRILRAWTKSVIFLFKVFPMLPSGIIDLITKKPVVEKVTYPTLHGQAIGDLYRPSGGGRHRAILVCLGVVPFEIEHPQVPRLGAALARSGFAALLYWSPAMRDLRLEPDDSDNIALAYEWLITQPYVDSEKSGLLGTCVGGSFALMAAASPLILKQVSFIAVYAPYSSAFTLLQDVTSSSTIYANNREPWQVDQLTRKVVMRSLTAELEPDEAELLRESFSTGDGQLDTEKLSHNGRLIYSLLNNPDIDEAKRIMEQLPGDFRDRLSAMSPVNYVQNIQSPLIILLHDRGDTLIPVGESRRLRDILQSHAGFRYKELQFQHLNPAKLPVFRLVRELAKFYTALYRLFYY
jgi:dienelactone hydrolase